MEIKKYRIYTDGSYNKDKPDEVHGGIVYWDTVENKVTGCAHVSSKDKRLTSGWNVGGEVLAAYVGLKSIYATLEEQGQCADSDPVIIELVYDYQGVGAWITGVWKNRNKPTSIWYYDKMMSLINSLKNVEVRFIWVKGHGDSVGNQVADMCASHTLRFNPSYNVQTFCFDDSNGVVCI